jgi:cytoskeletal protein CcmA (bactofilin family)
MFSKASTTGKPGITATGITAGDSARPAPRSAAPSIVSSDLKILGDLISAGDLQVDGIVEGDIQSRSLTVGDIVHQVLALEPGAFLEGHVRHSDAPTAGEPRRIDGKSNS